MKIEKYSFEYEEYESIDELTPSDALLVEEARKATKLAYAPYSQFQVGAYAELASGEFVVGSNQENASYPVGICAERVLMASAAQLYPNQGVRNMAISYHNLNGKSNRPLSPCGMCRQALQEFESRHNQPIRILLSGMEGKVFILKQATMLLPLSFKGDDMK
ncbi:cytidine deaminase [Parasediminibacterium sp. JCM 36343]|uniref:cytidine deaminase n=1 Tax=Parasediminibacterium sp. JCM 36343 TaxID=3374279 RepID=UPI00397CC558